jgi:hypothetical protein
VRNRGQTAFRLNPGGLILTNLRQSNNNGSLKVPRNTRELDLFLKSTRSHQDLTFVYRRLRGTFPPDNQYVVCATSASLLSTFAGYPVGPPSDERVYNQWSYRISKLDSLKSRLQASRVPVTIPRLAATIFREEGIGGMCCRLFHRRDRPGRSSGFRARNVWI